MPISCVRAREQNWNNPAETVPHSGGQQGIFVGKVSQKNLIRRNLIFRALLENGPLSLSDLKTETGMSLPVITSVLGRLRKDNLIIDAASPRSGQGRPPALVALNGPAGYILGLDVGRMSINLILLDLALKQVWHQRYESVLLKEDSRALSELENLIKEFTGEAGIKWDSILGIGLALPGVVQREEGVSRTYLHESEKPLRSLLEERLSKPVNIEHDVKAMALGELWFGGARGWKNVLCLNAGWGVGLGIIMDGRVYYGRDGFAGEFGHLQIVPEGVLCTCGKRGCLEAYASGGAIAQRARERLKNGEPSILLNADGGVSAGIQARDVLEAATSGDHFSIEIMEEAAVKMGFGLAQVINVLNPERIIFGGRISTSSHFFNIATAAALKYSLPHLAQGLEFKVSELGSRAGALGVGVLAASHLFEVEHLNPCAYI